MSLDERKARYAITCTVGRRNGRACRGICRRIATSANGPEPNESTVADVTKPTSFCQPGNGRKKMSPTMKVRMTLTHGTPRRLTLASERGAFPLRPIAYEMRAVTVV